MYLIKTFLKVLNYQTETQVSAKLFFTLLLKESEFCGRVKGFLMMNTPTIPAISWNRKRKFRRELVNIGILVPRSLGLTVLFFPV